MTSAIAIFAQGGSLQLPESDQTPKEWANTVANQTTVDGAIGHVLMTMGINGVELARALLLTYFRRSVLSKDNISALYIYSKTNLLTVRFLSAIKNPKLYEMEELWQLEGEKVKVDEASYSPSDEDVSWFTKSSSMLAGIPSTVLMRWKRNIRDNSLIIGELTSRYRSGIDRDIIPKPGQKLDDEVRRILEIIEENANSSQLAQVLGAFFARRSPKKGELVETVEKILRRLLWVARPNSNGYNLCIRVAQMYLDNPDVSKDSKHKIRCMFMGSCDHMIRIYSQAKKDIEPKDTFAWERQD